MLSDYPDQVREIGDLCFTRALRVFPDGSREVVLQKSWYSGVERVRFQSAAQAQDKINKRRMNAEAGTREEDSLKRACRRARKMVRWQVRCMGGDHLLTLTYRENMTDKVRLKRDWKRFVQMVTARVGHWPFVACIENQKRGAWHIHAAVKGFQRVKMLRACWLRVVGEGNGNIDVRGQWRKGQPATGGKKWSSCALANYLSKYIAKTFEDSEFNGRRYWPSKGIVIPDAIVSMVDADTWEAAITSTYNLVAEDQAFGVKQWADHLGLCYWVFAPDPPKCPF